MQGIEAPAHHRDVFLLERRHHAWNGQLISLPGVAQIEVGLDLDLVVCKALTMQLPCRLLDQLIEDYVSAASVAWRAGFHFVDVKACHGYLLHEFLSAVERPGPYGGDFERLERPKDPRLTHGFRQALLLHGVDTPGLGGMTTAAHTAADVEQTVSAVVAAVEMLRAEGLA